MVDFYAVALFPHLRLGQSILQILSFYPGSIILGDGFVLLPVNLAECSLQRNKKI